MFADAKSEIARFRKILLLQLVFLDLEPTLEDFFGLGPSHGDVNRDFFVTTDPKGTDCVAGLAFRASMKLEAVLVGRLFMEKKGILYTGV